MEMSFVPEPVGAVHHGVPLISLDTLSHIAIEADFARDPILVDALASQLLDQLCHGVTALVFAVAHLLAMFSFNWPMGADFAERHELFDGFDFGMVHVPHAAFSERLSVLCQFDPVVEAGCFEEDGGLVAVPVAASARDGFVAFAQEVVWPDVFIVADREKASERIRDLVRDEVVDTWEHMIRLPTMVTPMVVGLLDIRAKVEIPRAVSRSEFSNTVQLHDLGVRAVAPTLCLANNTRTRTEARLAQPVSHTVFEGRALVLMARLRW